MSAHIVCISVYPYRVFSVYHRWVQNSISALFFLPPPPILTLSVMKGLVKTLSTSHYLSDNRFSERKFCGGFISNDLPLWSESRTHLEQLLDQKTTVSHS